MFQTPMSSPQIIRKLSGLSVWADAGAAARSESAASTGAVTVFAFAGQQPIEVREPYAVARDWHDWLRFGGAPPPEMARLTDPANYVLEIRTDFAVTGPVPPLRLPADEVSRVGRFTLYRLRPGEAERTN